MDQIDKKCKDIREFGKYLIKQGKEACRKFLISTGAYNKDGTLKEEYK